MNLLESVDYSRLRLHIKQWQNFSQLFLDESKHLNEKDLILLRSCLLKLD